MKTHISSKANEKGNNRNDKSVISMKDNRTDSLKQLKQAEIMQNKKPEEELKQGKFENQLKVNDEELKQGKFITQRLPKEKELPGQGKIIQKKNDTGMPDEVKQKMENSFNTDFSGVRVHQNSEKAPEVGALAFTQGNDVHFAPGQYNPSNSVGQRLLGHELAHVQQQKNGRVKATTEIAGMPVNDNVSLEKEADNLGSKASM